MLVFLMFQYRPDTLLGNAEDRRWEAYTQAMDAFFLRAQQMGVLRIDISAAVFTEMFMTMIYGMVDAERRGRAASANTAQALEQLFLNGARTPA